MHQLREAYRAPESIRRGVKARMTSQTGPQVDSELVEAVQAILREPDWPLRFPPFATVPFIGSKAAYNKAKGKTSDGDLAFLPAEKSESTLEVLDFDSEPEGSLGSHDADVAYLKRNDPLPSDLRKLFVRSKKQNTTSRTRAAIKVSPSTRVLRSANPGHASTSTSSAGAKFNSIPRLNLVGVMAKRIDTAESLSELILAPLHQAIAQASIASSGDEETADHAAAEQDPDQPASWVKAALSILPALAMSPTSSSPQWRPQFFQYSLSALILSDCGLKSDALRPLGEYLLDARNLTMLELSGNSCFVSPH